MNPKQKTSASRRHFLLAVGAGGAASAAGLIATRPPTAKPSRNDKRATRGYRASEHIESYYQTTKL